MREPPSVLKISSPVLEEHGTFLSIFGLLRWCVEVENLSDDTDAFLAKPFSSQSDTTLPARSLSWVNRGVDAARGQAPGSGSNRGRVVPWQL